MNFIYCNLLFFLLLHSQNVSIHFNGTASHRMVFVLLLGKMTSNVVHVNDEHWASLRNKMQTKQDNNEKKKNYENNNDKKFRTYAWKNWINACCWIHFTKIERSKMKLIETKLELRNGVNNLWFSNQKLQCLTSGQTTKKKFDGTIHLNLVSNAQSTDRRVES